MAALQDKIDTRAKTTSTTSTDSADGLILTGSDTPPLLNINIGKLLSNIRIKFAEKIALISLWQERRSNYRQLHESVFLIARQLISHGVRAGDRVVVLSGNCIEFVELFFAVGGLGAIFVIINPTFTVDEILAAVDFVDPKIAFIADKIGYRNNRRVLTELPTRKKKLSIVQLGDDRQLPAHAFSWNQFCAGTSTSQDSATFDTLWGNASPDSELCIQFTSGTTGPRKAAILTHSNLINNASSVGGRLAFSTDDVLCCSPPLFHCFGLVCGVLAALIHGTTTIIPSEVFNAAASLRAITDHGSTLIHAVPSMFQAMLDDHAKTPVKPARSKFRIRGGLIAGSALSKRLLEKLKCEFGIDGLSYPFGMTELSAVSFMTSPSETRLLDDTSSVGELMPHTSARVVNDDFQTLPPDTKGELLIAGNLVFKGYYRNDEKTKETLVTDDESTVWLRTGDIVTLGASGKCTVVGRVKDMIKRGGENIAPQDIEMVLQEHPSIEATAVIGIPDARWGEVIGIFLQWQPGSLNYDGSTREIKRWLRGRLPPHKVPEHFFWMGQQGVPEQLPVNASGKVMKNQLQEIARALLGDQKAG